MASAAVALAAATLTLRVAKDQATFHTLMEQVREVAGTQEEAGIWPIELEEQTVALGDGAEAVLQIAKGFRLSVAAEGLGKARFMTKSPDGRLFIPDMVDYNLSREGRLVILSDFDPETRRFETETEYLSGLRGPHNVAFYTDSDGRDWLYLTLTEHLIRYPYSAGDTGPRGEGEVVLRFPNEQSLGADGIVWHITRTVLFHGDTMYVSIGSGCNLCEEDPDEWRAMIIAAEPDGSNARIYAEGIKNAVGLEWANGSLYATENGPDHLGDGMPDDAVFLVEENRHYGWPYCFESGGAKYPDRSQAWQRTPIDCGDVPMSFAALPPHSAPLGIAYFQKAHPLLQDSFLVALQGSWQPEIGNGYQVVRVLPDGSAEVFIDGFMSGGERIGRPVHILQWDDDSFFVSEDFNGRLYYAEAAD